MHISCEYFNPYRCFFLPLFSFIKQTETLRWELNAIFLIFFCKSCLSSSAMFRKCVYTNWPKCCEWVFPFKASRLFKYISLFEEWRKMPSDHLIVIFITENPEWRSDRDVVMWFYIWTAPFRVVIFEMHFDLHRTFWKFVKCIFTDLPL